MKVILAALAIGLTATLPSCSRETTPNDASAPPATESEARTPPAVAVAPPLETVTTDVAASPGDEADELPPTWAK